MELLANELLLELFEYHPVADLFRAFHALNSRFNSLLFVHFRRYRLDFRSVSKRDFDFVCQEYVPLILDRIISLRLSDGDETPEQIQCFISHGLILHQFTHLSSLSLFNLRSSVIASEIIVECHRLHHLSYLNFIQCKFQNDFTTLRQTFNSIWSLPKLLHCHLDVEFEGENYFVVPSMISTSLRNLSIKPYQYRGDRLACVFENTPGLRYLWINLRNDSDDQLLSFTVPSMIKLKIYGYETTAIIINLLQNMPNLRYLTVNIYDVNIDGHRWEQIIVDYLPRLIVFRLEMSLFLNNNKEQRAIDLVESFQTPFWVNERQWFVRCEWDPRQCEDSSTQIYLYTSHHTIKYYYFGDSNTKSRSTCPYDDDFSFDNQVHNLSYVCSPSSTCILSHYRFSIVHHLILSLPVDDNLVSVVPNFNKLLSLKVSTYGDENDFDPQSQLQSLLDRASCLYSLKFDQWSSSSQQMPPFEYICKSVRRLDLQCIDRYYNSQQCASLSHSPLGIHCEVLSIVVENRESIIELINMMSNLRALDVICRDDTLNPTRSSSNSDELIEWLQLRLPTTYTISRNDNIVTNWSNINTKHVEYKAIQLWIGEMKHCSRKI